MIKFEGELLERVSKLDHEIWKQAKAKDGYHYPSECPFRTKGQLCRKCSRLFVPYDQLPEDIKELNRIRWRNIDKILAKLGFEIKEVKDVDKDEQGDDEYGQDKVDPLEREIHRGLL